MQNKKTLIFKKIILIAIVLAVYFLGYQSGHQNLWQKTADQKNSLDLTGFWEVYNKIDQQAVKPVDPVKAAEGAIKGLVSSLDDPFSVYLSKSDTKDFLDDLNGQFDGIGAELAIKDQTLVIIAPLASSPAEKAGLKANDKILAIDSKPTDGLPLSDAVNLIRGKKGTKVELTILSEKQAKSRAVNIVRDSIKVDSVTLTERPDKFDVLKISQFGDDTSALAEKYAEKINQTKPKGVILDLRNNPGGLLSSSIDITSLFVENKTVVKTKYRDNSIKEDKTSQPAILKDIPLIVLVNEGSASASEIVSGALQDYQRAKIVGKKTFGKGSVQDLIDLKDGSTLRLTTALWLTPNDRTINHDGIKPDIEIEDSPDTPADEGLNRAIELLNKK